ncbi:hypothetical protein TRICI_000385 [Trichomonascus ciferrii]|uniref:Uncharacterized protein n=1 Tax=Trichomonascus ciferrii TaxID=44093 RepID=A0A642VDI2_9ASCO|nr:hypothetical protein TRICI_000385 [Trichomonascus ciferrii]
MPADTRMPADSDKSSGNGELPDPFEHLPPEEATLLKKQIDMPKVKVSYFTLFRYATKTDLAVVSFGYLCSVIAGAAVPLFTVVIGNLTQDFTNFFTSPSANSDQFQKSVNHNALYFLYLGLGIIVFTFLYTYILTDRGEVLAARIRSHYLAAILRQNIAYFDRLGAGEVTTRITSDTNAIQDGISSKAGIVVGGFSTFGCAFVIGFIKDWKLTFVLISVVAAIILVTAVGTIFIIKYTNKNTEAYGQGSSIAEEAFSAIRTAVAFDSQDQLAEKFDGHLQKALRQGINKGISSSLLVASFFSVVFFAYALALWQGSRFIASGDSEVGNVVTVVIAMVIGAFLLASVAPCFETIGKAVASASKIFEAIDRPSTVDPTSDEGIKLEDVKGEIELKNIKLVYPSRPDVAVLEDIDLEVKSGQTVALVGMSGSGKSSIIGLIERFYDPIRGCVTLDGTDVSELNVRWLRQQIALVSQEPILFNVSVYENITFGLIGTRYENVDEEKKLELVIEACKLANAWDFIQNLTEGLDTKVGERGFLMSGGQKQRIAIARAIIAKPKILLLDEATSALDTKSEGIVQDALDKASKDRTTIVIAHRLSTIKHADKIVVMAGGRIVESGTHTQLLCSNGAYAKLVEAQRISSSNIPEEPADNIGSVRPQKLVIEGEDIPLGKTASTQQSISPVQLEGQHLEPEGAKRSKEKWHIIIGTIGSVFGGLGYTALNVLFSKIVSSFMVPPNEYGEMRHHVNVYTGYLFMVGVILLVVFSLGLGALSAASEKLVRHIRYYVFKQFLRMDIEFHDRDENTSGSLASTLAKDAQSIEGLGGSTLGQIFQSLAVLFSGMIVALCFNWRVALVCISTIPVLVLCGFAQVFVLMKLEEHAKVVYEDSGSYACEGISAIRTVASLTREHGIWKSYCDQVVGQAKGSRLATLRSSLFYALSQGIAPWIMGLGFWYGTTLLKDGKCDVFEFFTSFTCVVFGAQSAGSVFSYAPNMSKAKKAAENISKVIEINPKIDTWSKDGNMLEDDTVQGNIEFKDVHFSYPTRPNVPVLKGLNLSVKREQYVALVGASGCGKSTTIQLIERFYDTLSGQVTLDGEDISKLNINSYRKQLGFVPQEPVLYSGTIRENILLGTNEDDVPDHVMHDAARNANIHEFVMSLPEGYDTLCGTKGTLLSGGQKQRIAIARALIRNPKVLLLDEATSALDGQSEKVVQQALDQAAKGRTTVAVAHRISSIQNADIIYVFDDGKICETGTHQQLLAKRGNHTQLSCVPRQSTHYESAPLKVLETKRSRTVIVSFFSGELAKTIGCFKCTLIKATPNIWLKKLPITKPVKGKSGLDIEYSQQFDVKPQTQPHRLLRSIVTQRDMKVGLASKFFGLGRQNTDKICSKLGLYPKMRMHQLNEQQVLAITKELSEYTIEKDKKNEILADIDLKRRIGSYAGRRHAQGLPVKGQRTRTNATTAKKLNRLQRRLYSTDSRPVASSVGLFSSFRQKLGL